MTTDSVGGVADPKSPRPGSSPRLARRAPTTAEGKKKLPRPIVFWSLNEKTAYRRNRVVQTRMNMIMDDIVTQRETSRRWIRYEAHKFRQRSGKYFNHPSAQSPERSSSNIAPPGWVDKHLGCGEKNEKDGSGNKGKGKGKRVDFSDSDEDDFEDDYDSDGEINKSRPKTTGIITQGRKPAVKFTMKCNRPVTSQTTSNGGCNRNREISNAKKDVVEVKQEFTQITKDGTDTRQNSHYAKNDDLKQRKILSPTKKGECDSGQYFDKAETLGSDKTQGFVQTKKQVRCKREDEKIQSREAYIRSVSALQFRDNIEPSETPDPNMIRQKSAIPALNRKAQTSQCSEVQVKQNAEYTEINPLRASSSAGVVLSPRTSDKFFDKSKAAYELRLDLRRKANLRKQGITTTVFTIHDALNMERQKYSQSREKIVSYMDRVEAIKRAERTMINKWSRGAFEQQLSL